MLSALTFTVALDTSYVEDPRDAIRPGQTLATSPLVTTVYLELRCDPCHFTGGLVTPTHFELHGDSIHSGITQHQEDDGGQYQHGSQRVQSLEKERKPPGLHEPVRLVANAGLLLPVTLAQHLGLREVVDSHVDLGDARGRANPGDKLLTLVASALAGGDFIDDADVHQGDHSTWPHTLRSPPPS